MDLLPNLVNTALIVLVGLSLNYVIRDRFRAQDKRIDRIEDRLDRFATKVDAEFAAVRSDLMNLALALGQQQKSAG